MQKMRLKEFWDAQETQAKNKILLEVSAICHNSIDTVRSWMLGYRNAKGLDREALMLYLKENFQVEIIEEGGER